MRAADAAVRGLELFGAEGSPSLVESGLLPVIDQNRPSRDNVPSETHVGAEAVFTVHLTACNRCVGSGNALITELERIRILTHRPQLNPSAWLCRRR
jgi:hypothetical protein